MARHPSLMKIIAHHGRGLPGVRPETTAALDALAAVETRLGIVKAVEGALSAYLTTFGTLGEREPEMFDQCIDQLEDAVIRMREAKEALAAGRVPEWAIRKEVPIIGEPEGTA